MENIYTQISRYSQPIIISFGTIGALFNLILFYKRKQLRSTSCSFYFRVQSFNDILVLYLVILPQWLNDQFDIDLTGVYDWYCRISMYLTFTLYVLSSYCVVLACFDRLCTSSSNVRLRRLATIRIARILTLIMIIIVFSVYLHVPLWHRLILISRSAYCIIPDPSQYMQFATILLIFSCLTPPLLMLFFCSLTLIFLRYQRRRIMPVNQTRVRQRDSQLFKMLFIYVISNIICTAPFTSTFFYQISRNRNVYALGNIQVRLFILLINVMYATGFYFYTLATPFYRNELVNLVKMLWQDLFRRNHLIANLDL